MEETRDLLNGPVNAYGPQGLEVVSSYGERDMLWLLWQIAAVRFPLCIWLVGTCDNSSETETVFQVLCL